MLYILILFLKYYASFLARGTPFETNCFDIREDGDVGYMSSKVLQFENLLRALSKENIKESENCVPELSEFLEGLEQQYLSEMFMFVPVNCHFRNTRLTPLDIAIYMNKMDIMDLLFQLGALLSYNGYSALKVATYSLTLENLDRLIGIVAPENQEHVLGDCLIVALFHRRSDAAIKLVKSGASVNLYDSFAPRQAIALSDIRLLQAIVGAKTFNANPDELLDIACKMEDIEAVVLFLDHGASASSALKSAIQAHQSDIILILLSRILDLNSEGTHLIDAVNSDNFKAVVLLLDPIKRHKEILKKGLQIDFNAQKVDNPSVLYHAFQLAKENANVELMELLLSYGGPEIIRKPKSLTEEAFSIIRSIPSEAVSVEPMDHNMIRLKDLLANGANLAECLGAAFFVGYEMTFFAFSWQYAENKNLFHHCAIYAIAHDLKGKLGLFSFIDINFSLAGADFNHAMDETLFQPSETVSNAVLVATALKRNHLLLGTLLKVGAELTPYVRSLIMNSDDDAMKTAVLEYELNYGDLNFEI